MLDVSTLNACASRLEVNLALGDQLLGVHQPRIHLQKRVRSERELAMEVSALGEVVTHMSLRSQEHQSGPRSFQGQTGSGGEMLDVDRLTPSKKRLQPLRIALGV
jgi:hypothetical protein